jgi:CheY-like chemotaxis protein
MKSAGGVPGCSIAGSWECDASVSKGDEIMSSGRKLRILLVEDDSVVRSLVGNMLAALGYEVVTAQDGDEALEIFSTTDGFHLILTDINMPRMDGWQLTFNLRQIDTRIPIIAVTGENPDSVLPGLDASGISRALFKPFNIKILQGTIEDFLPA